MSGYACSGENSFINNYRHQNGDGWEKKTFSKCFKMRFTIYNVAGCTPWIGSYVKLLLNLLMLFSDEHNALEQLLHHCIATTA